jgi:hypothetical protein
MRKQLAIFMAVFMVFALVSPSFASVGTKVDGIHRTVADINFSGTGTGGAISVDGNGLTFNLMLAGIGNGGATSMASSDLAVPITHAYVGKSIAADSAFSAGTLANGEPGQSLTLYIYQDKGSVTFILTPATASTYSSLSFDSVGDSVTLLYIDDTVGWIVTSYTSVTIN